MLIDTTDQIRVRDAQPYPRFTNHHATRQYQLAWWQCMPWETISMGFAGHTLRRSNRHKVPGDAPGKNVIRWVGEAYSNEPRKAFNHILVRQKALRFFYVTSARRAFLQASANVETNHPEHHRYKSFRHPMYGSNYPRSSEIFIKLGFQFDSNCPRQ
jgi:hypothetical protein